MGGQRRGVIHRALFYALLSIGHGRRRGRDESRPYSDAREGGDLHFYSTGVQPRGNGLIQKAAMNDFFGVYGVPDPARALRSLGIAPAWSDADVAFGGAPVWSDSSGTVIVSGELILDNADDLRRMLGKPQAEPGALLAELALCHGQQVGRHARGMFAVALWNTREKTLTLLRDGVGARTLYYAASGRACWFGARLRALRRCPAVSGTLSPARPARLPRLRLRAPARRPSGGTCPSCGPARRGSGPAARRTPTGSRRRTPRTGPPRWRRTPPACGSCWKKPCATASPPRVRPASSSPAAWTAAWSPRLPPATRPVPCTRSPSTSGRSIRTNWNTRTWSRGTAGRGTTSLPCPPGRSARRCPKRWPPLTIPSGTL